MGGGQWALGSPTDANVGSNIDAIRVIHKHCIKDWVISDVNNVPRPIHPTYSFRGIRR